MAKKLGSLIGLKMDEFDQYITANGEITFRPARLIPLKKPGDEMALTSIFLSSLRLIKEFRKEILSSIGMISSGNIYVYTEIEFSELNENRIDGLIIIVKAGTIKDAALLEMKNKSNEIEENQISRYMEIAQKYGIPRLITVSNQFVSEPTQFPISIKPPKNVELYHFSWLYILTIAKILISINDKNIIDEDQVEMMKEVVYYLEHNDSGIFGFTQMKSGWKKVVDKINAGAKLKLDDKDVDETVVSWLEEERDMALMLSRRLGMLVKSGESKYKNNLKARHNNDGRLLINDKILSSILRVDGAASNIFVNANFLKRNIEIYVTLAPPQDKSVRGQIGWLKQQLNTCRVKNEELFNSIENELKIGLFIKHVSMPELLSFNELEEKQVKDLGKIFSSSKKFVEIIEDMLLNFYQGIVQYLKKWEKPAPKMSTNDIKDKLPDEIEQ
jgi:hypothetical protein